ncbi:uncharacterized protein LOC128782247 [Vidua chalybeata]|uniref:uncharacterized protein LOC128782247 n=1 Tax=Vidua chalybeata TaxID=81927 RepID=UPI0023A7B354|nr:uncharacterized protein LOC128782247 [Vidua chalybeata]
MGLDEFLPLRFLPSHRRRSAASPPRAQPQKRPEPSPGLQAAFGTSSRDSRPFSSEGFCLLGSADNRRTFKLRGSGNALGPAEVPLFDVPVLCLCPSEEPILSRSPVSSTATRVPASGKLAAEREEGPRDDTKWPFSASQPPDHQGGRVAAWPSPAVQRSHEDGLHLFRRTGTLNQGNRRVLRSSVTISLQDEDLMRVPAGFLGPLHDCRDTTVLILEDSFNTPNEITILPEGKSVQMRLMADTGADVTIIPQARWPSDWELVPPCGRISGVGGVVHSLRSRHLVCVEGPEGQLATVRPFVVSSNILLLGRDVLSQWGARLDIPSPSWDF